VSEQQPIEVHVTLEPGAYVKPQVTQAARVSGEGPGGGIAETGPGSCTCHCDSTTGGGAGSARPVLAE